MGLIGTNAEVGTFPEDLVRGARSLGFDAEAREGLTLDDVRQSTSLGHPVIALAQLWRSQKDTPASATDEWDCGHYIVVLAVDDDFVYFQDPYIRMGKGFVPRKTFEDHWHQIMGGRDLARSGELKHLAIFIRGEESSRKPVGRDAPATPDLARLGSVNVLNVSFPEHLLPFDFLDDLRSWLVDNEEILRPDAFVLIRKDAEGLVSAMQGGRLRDEQDALEVNALIAAMAAQAMAGSADQVLIEHAGGRSRGLFWRFRVLRQGSPATGGKAASRPLGDHHHVRKRLGAAVPGYGAKAQRHGDRPKADACRHDCEIGTRSRRSERREPGSAA